MNNIDICRVGIYLRLSNEDKDKTNKYDDSESIKNQRNMLLDYIRLHPSFLLVDEYCDEDLSGAGTYRPQFERLIKDCENGKIDIVLCKSQSRFSRDMEIIEKYIHNKFLEWNVRFIGLSDYADTDNYGNKKARQINGLVNEWYLEDVSNNIRSAFYSKMKQGEFISPFASFGYDISKIDNNKLVVDKVAAMVVKKIFSLYLSGLGFCSIAKYLNQQHIPSPSFYKYQRGCKLNIVSHQPRENIKWNANAIKTILTNELYLGHLIQGKRTTVSYKNHKIRKKNISEWVRVENTHEAIIDKNTFDMVQSLMKERTKPLKSTGSVHLFSGKVFCLECHHYMRKKNSSRHEYLVCSASYNGTCSNKKAIRFDKLSQIVLESIYQKISMFYDEMVFKNCHIHQLDCSCSSKISLLKNQLIDMQNRLSQVENYLESLYEDKVNGIITLNEFQSLATKYRGQKKSFLQQIRFLRENISYYQDGEKSLQKSLNLFLKDKKLDRIMIQEFINKIYIGQFNDDCLNRVIKIDWNFRK